MSRLADLLEVQELDLAGDAARAHFAALPEHEAVPTLAKARAQIESESDSAQAEKILIHGEEEAAAIEVAKLAKAIEAAEVERYSGKRFDRDEAAAHTASQESLREKKAALEEREMELLLALDDAEARMEEYRTAAAQNAEEAENAKHAIDTASAKLSETLNHLAQKREGLLANLPDPVVNAYERVRGQPRTGGRGSALLKEGHCDGCRIKLPSMEVVKMMAEPDEAVIQCPQCRRVLVR